MNVTAVVIEQLEWDGFLRTVTFAPTDGADFWVARVDEYHDDSVAPFHVLDPVQERELARQMRRARPRTTAGYEDLGGGAARFRTQWRGISTSRSGLSYYALALPEDALLEQVAFTDPHLPEREYRYQAVLDEPRRRIVCYLECRSKLGSFDFDVEMQFRHDRAGCAAFTGQGGGGYVPDLDAVLGRAAGDQTQLIVQQFFDSSVAVNASGRALVLNESQVHGPIIGEVSGTVGAIGDSAQGEVDLSMAIFVERVRLRAELETLLEAARDDARMHALLATAVRAVDDGDDVQALSALRRAGRSGLRLARDLGANLVAAVIASELGIGI